MSFKKKIKINFIDFWGSFNKEDNDFINILRESFEVELSDCPDYIFYSVFGNEHLKYDCIRIFYTGECVTPNFNECDYAIGFDRLSFGDRYIRVPLYRLFEYKDRFNKIIEREPITKEEIDSKTSFCNFVYSNCFAQDKRTEIFNLLNEYKKVDSGGRYMNNVGGPVKDKLEFQSHSKFSIAFENTVYKGYSTEKIVDAFAARTIPIYYGDPEIVKDFNPKAFINCADYNSLEEVVELVKKIDNDDENYLSIINEEIIVNSGENLNTFLIDIFNQDIKNAARRPKSVQARAFESRMLRHEFFENKIYANVQRVKRIGVRLKKNTIIR